MVLWGGAVTDPEGAFFPRQMGIPRKDFVAFLWEAWYSRNKGRGRDFEEGSFPPERKNSAL